MKKRKRGDSKLLTSERSVWLILLVRIVLDVVQWIANGR